MYQDLTVTTANAERTFSKLKLIRNFLRNSMGQERLRNLAILTIERFVTRNFNSDDVIRTKGPKKRYSFATIYFVSTASGRDLDIFEKHEAIEAKVICSSCGQC